MKKFLATVTKSTLVMAALLLGTLALVPVSSVSAVDTKTEVCKGISAAGGDCKSTTNTLPDLIKNVINILLYVIGAVAVIMIIVGGIRYVTSNGDQTHVKAAKDTIMYSIIGLVVAVLAYAIVQFIVSNIK